MCTSVHILSGMSLNIIVCVGVCVFTEHFLSDGDISVDIGVTAAPVITANYIESYHKVNNTCIHSQIHNHIFFKSCLQKIILQCKKTSLSHQTE